MQVLVSDTNIWIDLHNGGLLDVAFTLPYQFVTTDFAAAELQQPSAQHLKDMGLVVLSLAASDVQRLSHLAATLRKASMADMSCYLLAEKNPHWRLLTGDGEVRRSARNAGLTCNGILWLLDELFTAYPSMGNALAQALRAMVARDAWLPRDECEQRLQRWCGEE